MSIKKFVKIRGQRFVPCDIEVLKTVNNPRAIKTYRGIMVINPDNQPFSEEESKWIEEKIDKSKDGI